MAGTAARQPSHTPFRFTSMTRSHVDGGVSRTPPSSPGKMPALLKSTWRPPKVATATVIIPATCSSSATSTATAVALPPFELMAATAS